MLRRFQPDVVLSFRKGMSVITLGAVLLYGRSRLRWIAREGNNTFAVIDDELQSQPARRLVRQLTARVYRAADRLLSICHELQFDLQHDLGVPPAQLRTIYNAVNIAEVVQQAALEPPAGVAPAEPYLIGVGRLERQKGFDVLLRALAGSSQLQGYRLLLVGEGSHEAQLRALAAELGIADRVHIAGWQDNPGDRGDGLRRAGGGLGLPLRAEGDRTRRPGRPGGGGRRRLRDARGTRARAR
jgi:glycosyltransferase involved in cell wall biosynthesis